MQVLVARLGQRRHRRWLVAAAGGLALLLGIGYARWLAPTRVALVNYPDFQAARIARAAPSWFTQVEPLPADRLDRARRFDAVLVFGRGLKLDDAAAARLRETARRVPLYVEAATDPALDATSLHGEAFDRVASYLKNGGADNYGRLLAYLRREVDGKRLFAPPAAPPLPVPRDVLFDAGSDATYAGVDAFERHLRAQPGWRPGRPKVALVTSVPGPFNANRDHLDALIGAMARAGMDVYPLAAIGKRLDFLKAIAPDAVVYMPHGRLTLGQADAARAWLTQRNIPLFMPLSVFDEASHWAADPRSFDGGLMSMAVTLPELDGAIVPMAVAAQFRDRDGYKVFGPLPGRPERFADVVARYLALKRTPPAQRRLAIYYYKGPGQSALVAGDLEVMPSLYALLRHLRDSGYRVEGLPATLEDFAALVQRRGATIGPYAEGDFAAFARDGDPATVSAGQLAAWCGKSLAQALCDEVAGRYGPAPGAYMRLGDGVAVARIAFGNVVILPQPLPGVGNDTFKLVHGAKAPPPWPYLASYLWTRNVFKADQVMHFGTHGSLEFTPGKQVALSDRDWPDALIGDLPHVYLYTTSNVGEGMIAKRRSYATLVSHLTPPFQAGEVGGPLRQLEDDLAARATSDSAPLRAAYAQSIRKAATAAGLDRDLGLPKGAWDEAALGRLADHVETIADSKVVAGLYTLGQPYSPADAARTAALMATDPLARALADLDVARGRASAQDAADPATFGRRWRKRAEAMVTRILDGAPAAALEAQVLDAGELAQAQAWLAAHARPTDDDLVRGLIGMDGAAARPARRPAPARDLEALTAAALAVPGGADFVEGLRSDEAFARASKLLDPVALARARTVARAIPPMRRQLEVATTPAMTALLGAMQAPGARARVLALAGDPALGGRVAAARAAAHARLGESAASRTDALQAAVAARPWPADDASLARLHDDLGFWQAAQGRLPEPYAAMLAGHADAVAAYAQALAAELARREAQARRRADAVVAVHTQLGAVRAYRERLLDSPRNEWAMLDRALAGGFVPALAGGDPILNPATLPTGHNMYGIDAEKAPSPQAWSVGKRLGDALIARYRQDHGTSPNKVAFTLWAGDFIHTEGASIAEILYLLGVEPTRDPFGRISGLRLIPARELGRPRVDVVVQTSGQLRDLAASRLGLINRAVAMAATADDGALANPVRAGTEQTERELKREGMAPAAARRYAGVRVFGGVDGAYGTGIMGMVESGDRWRDAAEVAATYIDNMGAAYGDGELWASNQPGLFRAALRRTDAVVQPLSSNTWGPISLDHVYEFAGGMDLAVRQVTGKDPAAYFNDYRNASSASLGEAKEAIAAEARATLLNDAFIARMAQGGASSAERFAETFRNVYGWNVMKPAAVDPALWDALYDTYVRDGGRPGIGAFFEKQNPYALEEMTAVMLETARKGYWAPAPAVLTDLAARHAALIRRFGPSGTGFVNDNQALAHFIAGRLPEAERTAYAGALQRSRYGTALDGGRAIHLEAVGDKARTAPDRAAAAKDAVRPAPRATAAGDAERPRRRWGVLLGCALAALAVVAGIRRIRRRHAQA